MSWALKCGKSYSLGNNEVTYVGNCERKRIGTSSTCVFAGEKTEMFVSPTVAVVWKSWPWSLNFFWWSLFCDSSKLGHSWFTLSTASFSDDCTQRIHSPLFTSTRLSVLRWRRRFSQRWGQVAVSYLYGCSFNWVTADASHHLMNMQSVSSMSVSVCLRVELKKTIWLCVILRGIFPRPVRDQAPRA